MVIKWLKNFYCVGSELLANVPPLLWIVLSYASEVSESKSLIHFSLWLLRPLTVFKKKLRLFFPLEESYLLIEMHIEVLI